MPLRLLSARQIASVALVGRRFSRRDLNRRSNVTVFDGRPLLRWFLVNRFRSKHNRRVVSSAQCRRWRRRNILYDLWNRPELCAVFLRLRIQMSQILLGMFRQCVERLSRRNRRAVTSHRID